MPLYRRDSMKEKVKSIEKKRNSDKGVNEVQEEAEDVYWDCAHEVSLCVHWDEPAVNRTINLFDQDNTIPFIARYRQEVTKGMTPEKLREVKDKYDELKSVKEKIVKILSSSKNQEKITSKMKDELKSAKSMTEVEHISAPLKSGSKRSLAERARELGLEDLANEICTSPHTVRWDAIARMVNPAKEGLGTKEEVTKGLQHIIADRVSKHKATLDRVRALSGTENERFGDITVEVSQAKKSTAAAAKTANKKGDGNKRTPDISKFADYIDRKFNINHIKPHQVLAVNRGENLKLLSVKLTLADREKKAFITRLHEKWQRGQSKHELRQIMEQSVEDGFKRLIEPLILRQARSEVNKRAEKASIDVFASNLKRLLLTPPVRGKVILGVDPGFSHGCKYAVTSATGAVLDTGVAYLHTRQGAPSDSERSKIKHTVLKHRCETVAIGNGTACRETESFFSGCIAEGVFKPLHVQYCIVDESGASIYSASPEAQRELPDYDVTIRGAVSIARRLQDPLAELVKIEPKHIGVGMYQHDCTESKLKQSLDCVVTECVSFTGADLNSSSQTLLRRIAGLDATTAQRIVDYRTQHSGFVSREQLLSVKGLGAKKYQQCAGFVRVLPQTRPAESNSISEGATNTKAGSKRKLPADKKASKKKKLDNSAATVNELDMTAVHPETYPTADRLMADMGVKKHSIGSKDFISTVSAFLHQHSDNQEKLSKKYGVAAPTLHFILTSLKQPLDWDLRQDFKKPLFRSEVVSFADLAPGVTLTGKVTNCVHFGVFVDIGVGCNGLLHKSKIHTRQLKNGQELGVGDMIEVGVEKVDQNRKQISLTLKSVL